MNTDVSVGQAHLHSAICSGHIHTHTSRKNSKVEEEGGKQSTRYCAIAKGETD